MIDGQWVLAYPGVEFAFGTPATHTFNRTTPDVGDAILRVADVDRPRQDGRAFGVDYRSGRTISFDLGIHAASERAVRAEAERLTKAWRADVVRSTPGAVAELRMQYNGRESVVFGRPRRYAPVYTEAHINNLITATADFACIDDLFYEPYEESIEFGIVPPSGGGLISPLSSPLSTTLSSDRSQGINVISELPVWPIVTIYGPVTNPVVTIGSDIEFEVRLDLAYDEHIVIDTRPWGRYALRNGTVNVSGSVRGTRLAKASLPAGSHVVGMKGLDPTGTASVNIAWRGARSSF